MAQGLQNDRFATAVLSWVAGYVDTAGFLKLNGLFTAHVTGNLVVAGAELAGAKGEQAVWVRLAVIPIFIAAVILTTVITRTRHPRLSNLLWFEAITLLIFTGVGVTVVPQTSQQVDTLAMFMAGAAGVFAMGVRNALMRERLGTLAPTTVMTGNLTQFTIDSVRLMWLRDYSGTDNPTVQHQKLNQSVRKFGDALGSFVLGAACGAFFMRMINFWSILLPASAIALLALNTRQREVASSQG